MDLIRVRNTRTKIDYIPNKQIRPRSKRLLIRYVQAKYMHEEKHALISNRLRSNECHIKEYESSFISINTESLISIQNQLN